MFRCASIAIILLIATLEAHAQQGNDWPLWKPYVLANIGTNNTSTTNFVETLVLLNPSSTGYVQKISGHVYGISFPSNSVYGSNAWMWIVANSNTLSYSWAWIVANSNILNQAYAAAVFASNSIVNAPQAISALWIARGNDDVVSGSGENMIARDTGWWHRDSLGNTTPNISETYPDFNWITNSLGELTPR